MKKKGYTLIEILVVVFVFSILGLIVTRVVATTLRSSGKSENKVVVRENVSYAMGVMERNIRNAEEIISCSGSLLEYRNADGVEEDYSCGTYSGIGRIRSSELGGFLTNSEISVDCSINVFSCPASPINYVDVNISAVDAATELNGENALTTRYGESVRIRLRDY